MAVVTKALITDDTGIRIAKAIEDLASASSGNYVHTQDVASATWTVEHNLGFYPNVTIVDSAGSKCESDVSYVNENKLVLTFSGEMSGKAYLS